MRQRQGGRGRGLVGAKQSGGAGLDGGLAIFCLLPHEFSSRLACCARQRRKETDGDGRERDGWIVLDYNGNLYLEERILE
jgi:hypothetical protein